MSRWGFGGSWSGGHLQAYVSDHVVSDPVTHALRAVDRHSPNECPGGRTAWSQIYVEPPPPATSADPYPRPRRRRTSARMICWDCREYLELENRRAFQRDFGAYELEAAAVACRVTRLDAGERREEIDVFTGEATSALYWRDRIALEAIAGVDLAYPAERRYEQAVMLAALRAATAAEREVIVAAARTPSAAPRERSLLRTDSYAA